MALLAFHGVMACGTTIYLQQSVIQEKDAHDAWQNIALQTNHLFLLSGIILKEITSHSFYSRNFFLLTPFLLALNFYNKNRKMKPLETSITYYCSCFYYLTALTVFTAAFFRDKVVFAIASTATFMLYQIVQSKDHSSCGEAKRLSNLKAISAIATMIGFGVHVFSSRSKLNKVSMVTSISLIVLSKLLSRHSMLQSDSPSRKLSKDRTRNIKRENKLPADKTYLAGPKEKKKKVFNNPSSTPRLYGICNCKNCDHIIIYKNDNVICELDNGIVIRAECPSCGKNYENIIDTLKSLSPKPSFT